MLAECATQLYIGRLMLLHIAYKAEKGMDLRQENSIAKVYLAHMVHHVIDTAIQLHGALGFSQDTVLAKWYTQVRSQRLVRRSRTRCTNGGSAAMSSRPSASTAPRLGCGR